MLAQLDDGEFTLPANVRKLLEIDSAPQTGAPEHKDSDRILEEADQELYFPLPSNPEQRDIANRIARSSGLLVQGPPGTGKSHTIANLLAHLLAHGKRVLVTSETPRALEVLREKIPDAIRDLCVVWLGVGRESQRSLERSVLGITNKKVDYRADQETQDIEKFRDQLSEERRRQAKLVKELVAARSEDVYEHESVFGRYTGTLQRIAHQIDLQRSRFGWLQDRPSGEQALSVPNEDLQHFCSCLEQLTTDRVFRLDSERVPLDEIPLPETFSVAVAAEAHAGRQYSSGETHRLHPDYSRIASLSNLESARDQLHQIEQMLGESALSPHEWIRAAAIQIAQGDAKGWSALLEATDAQLNSLPDRRRVAELSVTGLEGRADDVVAADAADLLEHIRAGGGKGFPLFRPPVVKRASYLMKEVRIDGRMAEDERSLDSLIAWLHARRRLRTLSDLWTAYTDLPADGFNAQLARFEASADHLRALLGIEQHVRAASSLCTGPDGAASIIDWGSLEGVSALRLAIDAALSERQLQAAKSELDVVEAMADSFLARASADPVCEEIRCAVRARDTSAYQRTYGELAALTTARAELDRYRTVRSQLQQLLPVTFATMDDTLPKPEWAERFRQLPEA